MPQSRMRFAAGFVLFENTPLGRRYLLLRNARHGTWGFAKGHRDDDEDDLSCARRELREETGLARITVREAFRAVVRYVVHDRGSTFEKVTTYFLAQLESGDLRLSAEHDDAVWVDADEARENLGFATLRELIDRAESELGDAVE